MSSSAAALLFALALDRALGEPPNRWHPVAWMGAIIARGRDFALAAPPRGQLLRGTLLALALPAACAALALVIARALSPLPVLAAILTALLLKPLFSLRALGEAAFIVRDALVSGDLELARAGLSSLCSRDPARLEAPELIAATVESIAENTSDSVVAPLFYFTCAGLPGAAFYRATNTLDAMIGYHGKYEWVGKAAARLDDVLNLLPARITALLLLLAAPLSSGDLRRGARTLLADGGATESPNAGRPMATMAGLLGVRLEKPGHYALGIALRPIEPHDITRAFRIASGAAYGAAAIAVALLWALELPLAGWIGSG